MKLATFTDSIGSRIGVVVDDHLLDLARVAPQLPRTMRTLLEAGPTAMDAVRNAAAQHAAVIPLASVRLQSPVPDPHKFFAIALNYHLRAPLEGMPFDEFDSIRAKQALTKAEGRQAWYNKQTTCITGPYDMIAPPDDAHEVCFEAELAFVISRTCRNVSLDDAPSCIAGYTICNDVTEGAWCRSAFTLTMGKSFDTFGPIGPWLVTPDAIDDPHGLNITGLVNGQPQQVGNTRDLIFNCYELVAFASRRCTLEAGDIVTTGMPYARLNALAPGDVIRCEIEGIGFIENQIRDLNAIE